MYGCKGSQATSVLGSFWTHQCAPSSSSWPFYSNLLPFAHHGALNLLVTWNECTRAHTWVHSMFASKNDVASEICIGSLIPSWLDVLVAVHQTTFIFFPFVIIWQRIKCALTIPAHHFVFARTESLWMRQRRHWLLACCNWLQRIIT